MKFDLLEFGFSVLVCLSCGAAAGYFGAAFFHYVFGWSI
jgi:hypothetical protein